MRYFLLQLLAAVMLFINCSNKRNKHDEATQVDSVFKFKQIMNHTIVEIFKKDEKSTIDSLTKYNLQIVDTTCLKYLYVFYASEQIAVDNDKGRTITIGECNIKSIGFRRMSDRKCNINYGVFVNDSVPTNVIIKTSMGVMITSFDVDLLTKKILNAKLGEGLKVDIVPLKTLYDSALLNHSFQNYIKTYKNKLHYKFLKVFS